MPYDPNGHRPQRIRTLLHIDTLQQMCSQMRLPVRIMIVQCRPRNLANILIASNRPSLSIAGDAEQQMGRPPDAKRQRLF